MHAAGHRGSAQVGGLGFPTAHAMECWLQGRRLQGTHLVRFTMRAGPKALPELSLHVATGS